jgi:hypothetical protein
MSTKRDAVEIGGAEATSKKSARDVNQLNDSTSDVIKTQGMAFIMLNAQEILSIIHRPPLTDGASYLMRKCKQKLKQYQGKFHYFLF